MPPVSGRQVPRTPQAGRRHGSAAHHDISTPPARANDPRSPRTRSDRRLADPPSAEPTIADVLAAVTFSRNETTARLDEKSAKLVEIGRTQKRQDEAIEEVARRTDRLEGLAKEQQAAAAALAARVEALENAPSRCASSAASSVPSSAGRSTDPHFSDPTIMRVSAKSVVSKQAAESALKPLFKAARVDAGRFRLTGPAVGRSFVLRPERDGDSPPDALVRQLMDARRNPAGEWMELQVEGPHGEKVPLFTDLDRSLAQRRVAWHLAQAKKVVLRFHPSLDLSLARSDGLLVHEWLPLFSCRFRDDTRSVTTSWERANLERIGADHDAIAAAFTDHLASEDAGRRGRRV